MKLGIRNKTAHQLTLFIEPYCHQHEIAPGEEAMIRLADGAPHSLDFHSDNWVSLWDEAGTLAVVEVISKEQQAVLDALAFVKTWLHQFGGEGKAAARDIDDAVEQGEQTDGYVGAHCAAYRAFRDGYRVKQSQGDRDNAELPTWSGGTTLAGAYRAGGVAALFNHCVRLDPSLIELGKPPFDTDAARQKFEQADAVVG